MIKAFPPPTVKKAETKTEATMSLQTMFITMLTSLKEQQIDKKQTILVTELKAQ